MDFVAVNYEIQSIVTIRNTSSVESAKLIAANYWKSTPQELIKLIGVGENTTGNK